jgi:hypothetical protein
LRPKPPALAVALGAALGAVDAVGFALGAALPEGVGVAEEAGFFAVPVPGAGVNGPSAVVAGAVAAAEAAGAGASGASVVALAVALASGLAVSVPFLHARSAIRIAPAAATRVVCMGSSAWSDTGPDRSCLLRRLPQGSK